MSALVIADLLKTINAMIKVDRGFLPVKLNFNKVNEGRTTVNLNLHKAKQRCVKVKHGCSKVNVG